MKKPIVFLVLFGLICTPCAFSQDYTGHYLVQSAMGSIEMILEAGSANQFSGTMIDGDRSFQVDGHIENRWLIGTVNGHNESYTFQAILMGDRLSVTLSESTDEATGRTGKSQTLVFDKRVPQAENASSPEQKVVINDVVLTEIQLNEFQNTYGARPLPGNYWYDTNSGLYGVVGYAAFGFMYPGHDFGPLMANASNGHTGVFINGRQLPQLEWTVWSYMLGYWIQPGRYWLDKEGNAGYEGYPTVLVNLFAAARQNAYNGQGGSGDNFWSTRFSAGHSNAGNTQGYVSVPGYGPVGYGF